MQEIGESREAWGWDVLKMVENFANEMIKETEPFYIVYACKADFHHDNTFRQTIKAYYHRPQAMLGILVWYCDHPSGELRFLPELSAPPDIPIDPALLSNKSEDFSPRVAEQGKDLKVLVS